MVRLLRLLPVFLLPLVLCVVSLSMQYAGAQVRLKQHGVSTAVQVQALKGSGAWKAPASVKPGISYIVDLHNDTLFSEVPTSMVDVGHGTAAWGDFDNDNDLDVLLTGICCRDSLNDTSFAAYSKIYRNDNGSFVDIDANLIGVNNNDGTIWCDYDNDGDLDLYIGGGIGGRDENPVARIYRNDGGTFVDIGANLPGVVGSAAWGDFDNDGDLDLLMTGSVDNGVNFISKLYRNDDGVFHEVNIYLPGVWGAGVAWGDYDNDGDLDLLLTGYGTYSLTSRIFRNDGPSPDSTSWTFTDIGAPITPVSSSSVAWGDYDGDGNLDILLSGYQAGGIGGITTVYKGDGHGGFTDIHPGMSGVGNSHVNWVDFDNDGDLDAVVSGQTPASEYITKIYRNDGPTPDSTGWIFTDIGANLQGVYYSATAWGDYDNDGRLDLLVSGFSNGVGIGAFLPMTRLYHNNMGDVNNLPMAPMGVNVSTAGGRTTVEWTRSTDSETPQSSLTYNVVVGSTLTGEQIVPGMSDQATGYHRVARMGNRGLSTRWTAKGLAPGTYYCRVQAVDNVFAGSPFTAERSFVVTGVAGEDKLPREFALAQNYPNPFNPLTQIKYQLPQRSTVRLKVYNSLGELVKVLVDGESEEAGYKSVEWNGTNQLGTGVASGVYVYRLEAVNRADPSHAFLDVRKMVLVK